MKKLLFLLTLTVTGFISQAQVVIKHDTVWYKGFPKDNVLHSLKDTITNNTASPVIINWNKSAENILTGWSVLGLCDPAACYLNSSDNHSATLNPGESGVWYVDMKAATTAQDGTSWVTLTTNYGDMVYMFQTWPTSVKDFDNNNLVSIYPNPATDKITIALTDKRIASVQVVNVIGRKMARFEVDPSRDHSLTYNLDHVANGVYLLQFSDSKGKILGVRRVTKN
jgi:hypothetical protein